ncbi:MAG: c-type cytochrome [Verrucomicrobiaceae bacterium]|nr:c-type cytochrome [Verrucomicrobiaceae bacterium]
MRRSFPFAIVLVSAITTALQAQVFRAGAVATDISPTTFPRIIAGMFTERTSDKLTDKLHSRAIVLDDGKMKIAFAIVDQCMMEQKLIDEAKALASKQCGIPVDRMMVSATHTHSAPAAMGCLGTRQDPEYAKFLIPKIAESIVEANKRLQPARIGWSSIDDWEHTHNRRWIRLAGKEVVDPFGNATGRANMHPGYLSKDVVGPSGPVDPQLSVISIQTKDGKPLAVLANYSQHYFGSTPVSADYFGLFCDLIEKHLGGGMCAMSQGTSGDLMWMDYGAEKKDLTLQSYTEGVVSYAKRALAKVEYQDHAELGMIEKQLTLKYRTPDKDRLSWAERINAQIQNDLPKDKTEVYAREAVILDQRKETTLKLQAIRIGDLSIATLPNEVYAITGLRLKWSSPFYDHFNIELANGAEGYIPPEEQHSLGGYTTWPARTAGLEVGAESKIRETLRSMVHELDLTPGRGMSEDAPPYTLAVIDSRAALFVDFRYETSDLYSNHSGAKTAAVGPHAFELPGFNAGRGYGDESVLKPQQLRVQRDKINRSIHLAGGHIETTNLKLGDRASIALWFWLGHESGASERSGHLIDALGATLVAHQFADHTVRLALGEVVPGFSPSDSAKPNNSAKPSAGGLKSETTSRYADDWHFAVLIRDGDQLRVHLDGDEKPILTGKAGENTNKLIFGQGLQGRLDEITVWDRAIESKLIAQLWKTSKVEDDNARHAVERAERAKKLAVQKEGQLKQHENWSVSMRFRNTKKNNVNAVTAYLVSRGPRGDRQAPGDHLGIGGNYKDSEPGKIFVFNGNAADNIVRGKTIIEPGSWNDVTFERSGSHVKVTLNGKVEIDAEMPVTAAGVKDLFFGRRCDDFAPLEGEFEKVVVNGLAHEVGRLVPQPPRKATTPSNVPSTSSKPSQPAAALAEQAPYPPLSPEDSLKKLHIREGFKAELIACEPVVLDPVAFDWDERGRLWVVEMADYPLGMDGKGKPGSRVVMLEDTDANGQYDKRTVIADGLNFATGILTWRDGVLVTAAPDILFIKGDGSEKKVLFTGFSEGNQQLRVNGLRWGMDGWVYCAGGAHTVNYNKSTAVINKLTGEKIELGARDFRFKPDTGEFDPQTGPSQFGRVRDDWDHWFGVQNSKPLWHYVLQDHYLRRNPNVIPPDPVRLLYPLNPPVYPVGEAEKRFHSFNQSGRYTSACGINFYRGGTLFDDGKMHAFTCEPFHRVVQHHVLEDDGVSFKAQPDTDGKAPDFFASEDHWCRPVMVRDGPDGALYIADMYRYIIEHPQWLPQNGKDELAAFWRHGDDKGRIYRISQSDTPEGHKPRKIANLTALVRRGDGIKPITTLASPVGWLRDKAEMLIAWSKPTVLEGQLIAMAADGPSPQARAQAAWTLQLLGEMTPRICERLLIDPNPRVREQGLIIAENFANDDTLIQAMTALANDDDAKVRLQLACSLSAFKDERTGAMLASLMKRDSADPVISGAVLISAATHIKALLKPEVVSTFDAIGLASITRLVMNLKDESLIARLIEVAGVTGKDGSMQRLRSFMSALASSNSSLDKLTKSAASDDLKKQLTAINDLLQQTAARLTDPKNEATLADVDAATVLATNATHSKSMLDLANRWIKADASSEAQRVATAIIREVKPKGSVDLLTSDWSSRTPQVRHDIIEALLSSGPWIKSLLSLVKSGAISANSLYAQQRAALLHDPNQAIAKLADEAFQSSGSPTRAAVIEKFKPALSLTGDAAKGKQVFTAAGCIACHQLEGIGLPVGPDLRSVVPHTSEKLLNSILDPSAVIEPGFAAYHCTLKSGEQLYGIVSTETSSSITMKLAGNVVRSVLRSEIKELKSTQTSLMPDGLEAVLTPQSLADLITYLRLPKP